MQQDEPPADARAPRAELAARRESASAAARQASGLDEALLDHVLRVFYDRARRDPEIGPLFAGIADWEDHIARIRDFWSSIVLRTGRYHGQPMAAHAPLPLRPEHFTRWLALFEQVLAETCPPEGAALLADRARRIAASLEHGLAVQRGELPRGALPAGPR